jgi:hypothetical protein
MFGLRTESARVKGHKRAVLLLLLLPLLWHGDLEACDTQREESGAREVVLPQNLVAMANHLFIPSFNSSPSDTLESTHSLASSTIAHAV